MRDPLSDLELTVSQYYYLAIIPYFLMLTGLVFAVFYLFGASVYITGAAVSLVFGGSLLFSSYLVREHLSDTIEYKFFTLGGIFFILFSLIFIVKYLS